MRSVFTSAIVDGLRTGDTEEEQARREAEEQERRQARQRARREARAKARREAEEKARLEALENARREAEETARRDAERQAAMAQAAAPGKDSQAGDTGLAATRRSSLFTPAGWRTRRGLLLLITVPALALAVLATVRVIASKQSAMAYQQVEQLAVLSGKVAGLAQALETERNETITFIVLGKDFGGRGSPPKSAGSYERAVLRRDYMVTDALKVQVLSRAAGIGSSYPPLVRQDAQGAITAIRGLPALRATSTGSALPALVVIQEYASTISDVLALNNEIALGSNDSSLADTVRVLGLISGMKAQASEQGAILISALTPSLGGQGVFGPDKLAAIRAAEADQQSNVAAFEVSASADQRELYNNALSGTLADRAQSQEQQAISLAESSLAPGAQAAGTPAASTDPTIANASAAMAYPVNALRGVETRLVSSIISRATTLRNSAVITGTAFGLLLGVLALLYAAVLRPPIAWRLRQNHRDRSNEAQIAT